jgi:hypothetical protein
LSDNHRHRFEELNHYSHLMTRWFCEPGSGRIADKASINRLSTPPG